MIPLRFISVIFFSCLFLLPFCAFTILYLSIISWYCYLCLSFPSCGIFHQIFDHFVDLALLLPINLCIVTGSNRSCSTMKSDFCLLWAIFFLKLVFFVQILLIFIAFRLNPWYISFWNANFSKKNLNTTLTSFYSECLEINKNGFR